MLDKITKKTLFKGINRWHRSMESAEIKNKTEVATLGEESQSQLSQYFCQNLETLNFLENV